MRRCARAIIIEDDNILLMRRDKFGQQYYVLIGGHVKEGEGLERALYREIHEETMIRVANPKLVYLEHAEQPYGDQYVYTCDYISGVPMLHPDSDERKINHGGDNLYTPMWIPLSSLPRLPFRSEALKQRILEHLKTAFPDEPEEFNSTI